MQVQYLEEASVSLQGIAEVKFDSQKSVFGPTTTELNFTVEKTVSKNIKSYSCQWDSSARFDCSSRKLLLMSLGDGDHILRIKVAYDSGQSEEVLTSVRIDRTPPMATFLQIPGLISNLTSGVIQFAAQDALSGLKSVSCSLDGAASVNCSQLTFSYLSLSQGLHTLRLNLVDFAENRLEKTYQWTVDTLRPTVSLLETPAANSNQNQAQFLFSGLNYHSFECSLDGSTYSACSSPKVISGLETGAHTFRVRALRNNGNISVPAEMLWVVDTSVPTVYFSKTPSTSTNQKQAQFVFNSVATGQFFCSLDTADFEACSSPKDYSNLGAGNHRFRLKIRNVFGTESLIDSSSTFNWNIDLSVPTVLLSSTPASMTNDRSASFVFAGDGIKNYQCRLDAGSFEDCISPKKYLNLSEGSHRFQVKGSNAVGTESAMADFSWTIETAGPVILITSQPASISSDNIVSFTFASSNAQIKIDKYECSMDSTSFSICTSPYTSTKLSDGTHLFKVRATSTAGNLSEIVSTSFEIDSVVPVLTMTASPALYSKSDSESISFTSQSVSATYRCQQNLEPEQNCQSPWKVSYMRDQAMTVFIKAISRSGLESNLSKVTWIFDKTAPSRPELTADVSPITQKTTASLNFTSNDGIGIDHFVCSLDGASPVKCSSPFLVQNLLEGRHEVSVTGTDKATNVSESGVFSWFVDLTAPQISISGQPISISEKSTEVIQFSVSDNGGSPVSVTCQFDGVIISTGCSSPLSLSVTSGVHNLVLKATDSAGNSSETSVQWTTSLSLSGYKEYPNIMPLTGHLTMDIFDSAPRILKGDDKSSVFILSSCGVLESKDSGLSFVNKKMNLPESPLSMAKANGRIFIGARSGVFISVDDGTSFRRTLDVKVAQKIFESQMSRSLPCSEVPSFGNTLGVNRLEASGTTVIVGTSYGTFVSSDSGETFNLPTMSSGDYVLPELNLADIQFVGSSGSEIWLSILGTQKKPVLTQKGNAACNTSSDVPAYGLLRSIDGGKTFRSIPAAGYRSTAVLKSAYKNTRLYLMGNQDPMDSINQGFIRSLDSGSSFSQSAESPVKSNSRLDGEQNMISETANGVLNVLRRTDEGTQLYRSEDEGNTFVAVAMSSSHSHQKLVHYGLVESNGKILVSSNQGLWVSRDEGKTYQLSKQYKSNYCVAPWWHGVQAFASSGSSLYVSNKFGNFISTNDGQTFDVMMGKGLDPAAKELYATGVSTVYAFGSSSGIYVSQDNGSHFSGPFQTFKDVNTQETLFYSDSNYGGLSDSGSLVAGYYLSSDGTDQRVQLKKWLSENSSLRLMSALSLGNRIVASVYPFGVVVYENGIKIYENSEIGSGGSTNFIRIRKVNGIIYLLGQEIWSSHDLGKTFKKLSSAPHFGVDAAAVKGSVWIPDSSDFLWKTQDQGQSFNYFQSDLQ